MRDLRQYWEEVNAIQKGLPESVWLAPRHGGPLVEVTAPVGAKLIHGKTHRLANEEEIDGHRAGEDKARRKAFHDDLRRKGIAVVPMQK